MLTDTDGCCPKFHTLSTFNVKVIVKVITHLLGTHLVSLASTQHKDDRWYWKPYSTLDYHQRRYSIHITIPVLCVLQFSISSRHFLHILCEHGSITGSAYSSKQTGQVSSSSITSKLNSMWNCCTNATLQIHQHKTGSSQCCTFKQYIKFNNYKPQFMHSSS